MLRKLALPMVVALVAGCAEPGATLFEAESQGGLALSLAASTASIAPGDTVRLVARLENGSDLPVRLDFSSGCQILLYVEDAGGRIVHPEGGGWICTAALTSLELGPREVVERTFVWTGQTRGHDPRTFAPTFTPLPPGSYRAYATLAGVLDGERVTLRSDTETVQVR